MKKRNIFLLLLFAFILCGANTGNNPPALPTEPEVTADTMAIDGPYILYQPEGNIRIISVDESGVLKDEMKPSIPVDSAFRIVTHDRKHRFNVCLHPLVRQEWDQGSPGKLLVISDPHGNFDCFYSVLKANGVINDNYEWTFGRNHLMIIGDIFDRGSDVLPIFWLTYKLEKEASDAGGAVHFLYGNHESMVLMGDLRYTAPKYNALAERIGSDYNKLFTRDTELGRWLAKANSIQIIGRDLFVHAGLTKGFYERNFSIPDVNEMVSAGVFMNREERKGLPEDSRYLLSGSSKTKGGPGILWYRGMVGDEGHEPLATDTLGLILERYDVDRIIVGHTIFDDVSFFYDGKVVAVNVDNQRNFDLHASRGLLIEQGETYIIGDEAFGCPILVLHHKIHTEL